MQACPICATPLAQESRLISAGLFFFVPCRRCGPFRVSDPAADDLAERKLTEQQIATLSGFLRENRDYFIKRDDLPRLLTMRPLTLPEKGSRVLQFIASNYPGFGESCDLRISDTAIQVAAWMFGDRETTYVVQQYLGADRKFLRFPNGPVISNGVQKAVITAEGWEHLDSLKKTHPTSTEVFIAMSFDASLLFLRDDVFYATLEPLGYRGFRVDDPATDDVIDDAIIAGIKKSKFIIADFTDQRRGVYYEAGFAAGLGLTVLRTCREDDKNNLHFDVDHYPFLFWSQSDLEGFKRNLANRIISWVGRGPGAV